ncbi:hypothetical protein TGS27_0523 [Geobacillus stearothermophilus]|nr:hypothetical protein TGS27_0523 [Geobacillus stearothermophilus]
MTNVRAVCAGSPLLGEMAKSHSVKEWWKRNEERFRFFFFFC